MFLILLSVSFLIWSNYRDKIEPSEKMYKTFWPRLGASIIDSVILYPLSFGLVFLSYSIDLTVSAYFYLGLSVNAIIFFYYIYLHGKYGQTVGKALCKVRILDFKSGKKISYYQALLRDIVPMLIQVALFSLVIIEVTAAQTGSEIIDLQNDNIFKQKKNSVTDFILFFWFIIEMITMLTNSKRRALHDYIAGTVVFRTNIQDQ